MGIFSGIFKSRDAPTNRTAGSAYSFFLGQSAAGKRVNERSAMQTSAVCGAIPTVRLSETGRERLSVFTHSCRTE